MIKDTLTYIVKYKFFTWLLRRLFVDQNDAWESDLFEEFIPNSVKQMINGVILPPRENMGADYLAWGCTSDGCFSTESAYLSTHIPTDHHLQNPFNLVR